MGSTSSCCERPTTSTNASWPMSPPICAGSFRCHLNPPRLVHPHLDYLGERIPRYFIGLGPKVIDDALKCLHTKHGRFPRGSIWLNTQTLKSLFTDALRPVSRASSWRMGQHERCQLWPQKQRDHDLPDLDAQVVLNSKVPHLQPSYGRPSSNELTHIKTMSTMSRNEHRKPCITNSINNRHMIIVLDRLSNDIITWYENNIKQRCVEHVEHIVNL
eukprot:scaffold110_cov315-Pavlova_lutheri.AAC.6